MHRLGAVPGGAEVNELPLQVAVGGEPLGVKYSGERRGCTEHPHYPTTVQRGGQTTQCDRHGCGGCHRHGGNYALH